MDDQHLNKKKKIKKTGIDLVIIGGLCSAIGLISFFSSFFGNGFPFLFFLCFIGFPLLGIGGNLLSVGYRREIKSYMKDEDIPVVKDSYYDLKPEINDFVDTIKGNERKEDVIICSKCGERNDDGDRFCKRCGQPILKRRCPNCLSFVDEDSTFCPKCGRKL